MNANFLGVFVDVTYANWNPSPEGVVVRPDLPSLDTEEYPEWIDLLEAVCSASHRFVMVELGAGFGRWLVDGAAAYRQLQPDGELCLVGVEAEPTHFRWLRQHMERNDIDLASAHLIEAAVSSKSGRVMLETFGDPAADWGQRIRSGPAWLHRLRRHNEGTVVNAITLRQALCEAEGLIDLVDLDIQGAEADVLTAGADDLDRVRRVHIGTHGAEQERGLRTLFTHLGWECHADYPAFATVAETSWGGRNVAFADGVQTWVNPAR